MIVLDNNDVLAGDASTNTVVDYVVSGYVGTTATLLAQSQLSSTGETTIYTSGADGTVVASISLTNKHSSAVTVNLFVESRKIIPVDMSLGVGYTLLYDGQRITITDTAGGVVTSIPANQKTLSIAFIIDGGGAVITTGLKVGLLVDFACTIDRATTLGVLPAETNGSIVLDIWKDTYANHPPTVADTITASAKPTISGAQKAQDSTLTGWTKTIDAGDILFVNVDSVATFTAVTLILKVTRT